VSAAGSSSVLGHYEVVEEWLSRNPSECLREQLALSKLQTEVSLYQRRIQKTQRADEGWRLEEEVGGVAERGV
jgi:hypothetical protein